MGTLIRELISTLVFLSAAASGTRGEFREIGVPCKDQRVCGILLYMGTRKMAVLPAAVAALNLTLTLGCVSAQHVEEQQRQIRKLVDGFAAAENRGDAAGISALFTKDGEVLMQGTQIAKEPKQIAQILTAKLPWSEVTPAVYNIERIRMLDHEAAVVDAQRTYHSSLMSHATAATFIVSKVAKAWRISSYRNAHLCVGSPPDSPFALPVK